VGAVDEKTLIWGCPENALTGTHMNALRERAPLWNLFGVESLIHSFTRNLQQQSSSYVRSVGAKRRIQTVRFPGCSDRRMRSSHTKITDSAFVMPPLNEVLGTLRLKIARGNASQPAALDFDGATHGERVSKEILGHGGLIARQACASAAVSP